MDGSLSCQEAARLLGVDLEASSEELRQAYLRAVKVYPPERCPLEFQRVRAAYEVLNDPLQRARQQLFGLDPRAPLSQWLEGQPASRAFLGPEAWIQAMRRS